MTACVLVVEDELAIFTLIEFHLKKAGFDVIYAPCAKTALVIIEQALPDLLLVDWMLPNMAGDELIKVLRNNSRTRLLPIIMLTAKGEESDKETGLNSGADDYVVKPFSPRELIARINALLRRLSPQKTSDIITKGRITLDGDARTVAVDGVLVEFAPTEFKLLHFFMTHENRTFSRNQLLDMVWGDHVFIEERTVDVHIRRLRRQLVPFDVDYIKTIRGTGYRFCFD